MIRSITVFFCFFSICASTVAKAAAVGDTVLAYWKPSDSYFVGTAVEKTDNGFLIVFEDGETSRVPASKVRRFNLKVGSTVIARGSHGEYHEGKIAKAVGRSFYIHYEDGDKRWVPWSWISVVLELR